MRFSFVSDSRGPAGSVNTFYTQIILLGSRPGLYWQLMWRFISPLLMLAIISSSTYSMFSKHPTYSAWNEKLVFF